MCTNKVCTFKSRGHESRIRGFTLIELIFFIVVVSVGLAGILKVMDVTVKSSADPMVRKQAMALAESILQEVLQKAYTDPDGVGGESTRATFDDVDDYNGRTNATFTDLPASLSGYVIGIAVTTTTLGSLPAKKVAVTVTHGSDAITLTGYRTNY